MLYNYRIRDVVVVDGGTLSALVDLGFSIQVHRTIRLAGVHCPELCDGAGPAARAFTQRWFSQRKGKPFCVSTVRDYNGEPGQYMGFVTTLPDKMDETFVGDCLNEDLLTAGHATRVKW